MAVVVIGISLVVVNRILPETRPAVVSPTVATLGLPFGTAHSVAGGAATPPASPERLTALPTVVGSVRVQVMWSLALFWAALAVPLVAASGVLGWLLTTRTLRRLRRITGAARRLSADNLDQHIDLGGPRDELLELADTFNRMLGRLDAAFAGRRRFTANAAHELRTPLAVMRTQVDVALTDPAPTRSEPLATVQVVGEAVHRSQHLLDGLLILARGEAGPMVAEPVDLAQATAQAVERVRSRAHLAGVTMRSRCGPAPVRGDRVLLERAAGNLVENAVAYNHDHGWVEVVTEKVGDRSLLRVSNSGPVVPAGRAAELFEPFVRLAADASASRPGAGLGLSIVRAIAGAHAGRAEARALPAGGLEVTLELPADLDGAVDPHAGGLGAVSTASWREDRTLRRL